MYRFKRNVVIKNTFPFKKSNKKITPSLHFKTGRGYSAADLASVFFGQVSFLFYDT